ncbi:hypothetical protein ACFCV9_20710 [Streptomyces sp. NPDC056367]|uniref:hypothetical protein n=1 Tax=unclassified Streptomyces TaxID=2593676 RepID=UPI0035D60A1B
MSDDLGFTRTCCGEHRPELALNDPAIAPDVWDPGFEADPDYMLSTDQCVIKGRDRPGELP